MSLLILHRVVPRCHQVTVENRSRRRHIYRIFVDLDYEDYRIGPPTTSLNLSAATGIIQMTRSDVKRTIRNSSNDASS